MRAGRRHGLLPRDDCLYPLQATIALLARASLHRCFRRHGIGHLPEIAGATATQALKTCVIGFFRIDIAELRPAEGKLFMLVAIDGQETVDAIHERDAASRPQGTVRNFVYGP